MPGDDVTRRALGYVHANCAHCHNQARPLRVENARCFDPDNELGFTLDVDDLASGDREQTAFFRTALGDASAGAPFARGDVQESFGLQLMSLRDPRLKRGGEVKQMPPRHRGRRRRGCRGAARADRVAVSRRPNGSPPGSPSGTSPGSASDERRVSVHP